MRITSYAFVSKTWNSDLYSGAVGIHQMVDYAVQNNLVIGFRVTKDGLIIKQKRILTLDDIEAIAKEGIAVYIEGDYDLLKGKPRDPNDPIMYLARYNCNLKKKCGENGKILPKALRVTVAHDIAQRRDLTHADLTSIVAIAKEYNSALAEFDGALAMENTCQSLWDMDMILRGTEHLERIGYTWDPGNFSWKELQQRCAIMPEQNDILSSTKQHIGRVYIVHLKQIGYNKALPTVVEYPAGKFRFEKMIKNLQKLGYKGVFAFEPPSVPDVIANMDASLDSVIRLYNSKIM